jgi:quinoprotein glucose dehydrogenase
MKKYLLFALTLTLLVLSCMKYASKGIITLREDPRTAQKNAQEITAKTTLKLADGLQIGLWATDSLAPDPIAMSMDDQGRVYLTRSMRMHNSEFDIRGHQDWMTASISLQSVEERRDFLHKTFATERSKENEWLKDLNWDGKHDWRDLAVEKNEVWRLEDKNHDGLAETSTRVVADFNDEVSDVIGGILVREHDAFLAIAPDLWRMEDTNKDGIWDKKTSIATGFGVHIGFSGHNMSGIVEGPDGRIWWNIGDIGANITSKDGKNYPNPNSGLIARCEADGSNFEIFATGLRNTHEFVFDEYGNLISSDNDGDYPDESERLVHVVEGSDAGWRSNWQYGKYTDPKNNNYNVWMDEKLSIPHWEGQAAYIIPPIMNYHNGPTGMIYNPGTALGKDWVKKFFLVEFVGTPTGSPIWSFGLKPKGASFVLDGEKEVVRGILPTGIYFGPDGALYAADWVNGWGPKDYGRVWKIDVAANKNDLAAERLVTQRLMQLNYTKQSPDLLYTYLFHADMRIRKKAQFELVKRGKVGLTFLLKATEQRENQLARIHGIWGVGQLGRKDKALASPLVAYLQDKDPEIVTQIIKLIGDVKLMDEGANLLPFLKSQSPRLQFFAAEALGQIAYQKAVDPLIELLKNNDDKDLYIRHAAVLALSRIGQVDPIFALVKHPSRAVRIGAVLVLRHLKNEKIAGFLKDDDEYIVTEVARAINDDLSIPTALPALSKLVLNKSKWSSEPLLRRAINAALRVGGNTELSDLIQFASRDNLSPAIKAEALATLSTWASPSVLDRVDGRYRGESKKDVVYVRTKLKPLIETFIKDKNPETIVAVAGMLTNLEITDHNADLVNIYNGSKESKVKTAILKTLDQLKYPKMESLIKSGMEDTDENIRTSALGLLNNSNVSKESLPALVASIFTKGGIKEQQQLLVVLGKLDLEKTQTIFQDLLSKLKDKKLSPDLNLELKEAIEATGSAALKTQLAAIQPSNSILDEYKSALSGGDIEAGRALFFWNSTAQCVRCHNVMGEGGKVGPELTKIASTLTLEQILQAMVDPSARIAPGYGSVSLTLKGGQQVYGVLSKETATELTLTTSSAEPMVVPISRIEKRSNLPSSMPNMAESLTKREVRDLVAFLGGLK